MPARILLIDDNHDYGDIVSYYLKTAGGYDVEVSLDGREGLAKARSGSWDLIITDLMLPGHNGYEICALLKQDLRYQKIPVLILTASKLQAKDEQLAKECGADDFCQKSLEPRQLAERVRQLLAAKTPPGSPAA